MAPLERILKAGTEGAASPEAARVAWMTNAFCLLIAGVSVPFLAAYQLAGQPRANLAILPLTVAAIAGLVLTRRGHVTVARHLTLAGGNLCIFTFAAYLGPGAGVHVAFLSMVGHVAMLFRPHEWRHALAALLEVALLSALVFAGVRSPLDLPPMAPAFVTGMAPSVYFLTLALLLVTLSMFTYSNLRAERRAEDARRRLSKETRLVELLQDVAIVANNATGLEQAMTAAQARIAVFSGWRPGPAVVVERPSEGAAERLARCRHLQRVAAEGRTLREAASDCQCALCHAAVAKGEGLAVGVPVVVGRKTAAVMVFYAGKGGAEALTEPLVATLDNIGKQLASVEERRRSQEEIDASHVKMIAAAKMATLGEMAGGIAHEVNNPLAVIQGYLARIRRHAGGSASPQTEEAIDAIYATILRITKIVNGLRAFARDSASDPLEEVPVAKLVTDTLALSAERFRSKGIALEVPTVDPRLTLACRPTEISQVLINLLNNAYDAVLEQPVRRVALGVEASGAAVSFVVEDTGHGVPEGLKEKILQPFFTTKPVGRGTGLGLSISKGIVEAHGGTIECASGGGLTRFRVCLPLEGPEGGSRSCR